MKKRPAKRPSLFKDNKTIESRMRSIGDALIEGTLNAGMEAIKQTKQEEQVETNVKRMPKYLQVTQKRMEKLGVVDLKPYFAHSKHKINKPGGGWYVRVPIRRKARDMSRRMYEQLRAINISPNESKTVISDYLYDRRRSSEASWLNYTPKSYTIEKKKEGGGKRHTYTAYRTVSDKSPANSWIVNRSRITKDNTSKTMVSNVNRLMKWKMRNGWQ